MKGIVKQGVRCRDCGIACHKHCKDHVVVDCTKRKERKCKGMTLATVRLYHHSHFSVQPRSVIRRQWLSTQSSTVMMIRLSKRDCSEQRR